MVQYQLPDKFCTLFQRFGRGARDSARVAWAILIVESKYFDDTRKRLQEQAAKQQLTLQAKKRKAEEDRTAVTAMDMADDLVDVKPDISKLTEATTSDSSTLQSTQAKLPSTPAIVAKGRGTRKRKRSIEDVTDNFINAHLRQPSSANGNECRRTSSNKFFANPAQPAGAVLLSLIVTDITLTH